MTPERAALKHASQTVFLILAAWGLAAVAVTSSGVLADVPRPALPAAIAVLSVAAVAVCLGVPKLRWWLRHAAPRWLIAVHVVRFVGVYFLWLAARERLPAAFVAAGWADIAVAAWAVLLLATGLGRSKVSLLAWNIVGLIDILLVVGAAARLALRAPESLVELTHLPLGLLPTFIVPMIIASHVLLFVQLAARREAVRAVRPVRLETA